MRGTVYPGGTDSRLTRPLRPGVFVPRTLLSGAALYGVLTPNDVGRAAAAMNEGRSPGRLLSFLAAGGVTGLLSVALFGLAHALTIVPIWSSLARGIPFGFAAGLAMAWALFELREADRLCGAYSSGAAFGALIWAAQLPMTAVTILLRQAGLHTTEGPWEVIIDVMLGAATGGAIGWILTRRRRPVMALAIMSVIVALTQAGPIPLTNSVRAARFFGALSLVYVAAGIALAFLVSVIDRCRVSPTTRE